MVDRRLLGSSVFLALCLVPAVLLAQDVVFRADGGRLRGKIVSETSRGVKIKTPGGTLFVPRDEISSILRDGDVFKTFAARKDKLGEHDQKAWYELGVWAQGQEYTRIFKFEQELTRPFPVQLYGSQREFMSRTGKGAGTGGFYDGQKIVGFHGTLGSLNTQSVLFHEGTHQFQGLVMGRNMWRAKIWLIEGLAVYFEACEVNGRRLNVVIPASRLASVRRAIHAGTYVPLRELIRMEQAQFGALHYAHAWSLIHFLVNGARGGKKRFVEYWEKTKQGGYDGVQLFEERFDRPMEEIEAGWKEYVLALQ